MPKQIIEDNIWRDRIKEADLYYNQWEGLFKCKILDQYYEGIMWKSQRELGYNPYVINKFFETIAIKIAEFMPTVPVYQVAPRPNNSQYDLDEAANSAQLKEDTLNSIVHDNKLHFAEEMEMAYKDSFTRFGIIEVGYSADWIMNPNANKPLLDKDTDRKITGKAKIKEEPEELPANERVFIKHIPARTFRVGGLDHKYLTRTTWCGYYEFIDKGELQVLPGLINRDKIESSNTVDSSVVISETGDRNTDKVKSNCLKVWRLWDMKSMMQVMYIDEGHTIFQRRFKRLPLFDYRPDRRTYTDGFYPIPPAFNWLSPQDEINETREMLRAHRRRFVRKFMVVEGMMDDEEIEKFETGPDGAIVKVKRIDALQPVENADLGQAINEAIQTSADDLDRIAGTSQEDRGIPDRTTATQAQIVQQRASIRSQKDQMKIVQWFSNIGREILLVIRDKFVLGLYVRLSSPEGEQFLGEIKDSPETYRYVSSEDLNDGYDFRIDVDITSLSATAQMDDKQRFMEFISVLQQFPLVSFSPTLVREAAYRIGYRNIKAIKEFQKMALLMYMGKIQQLQQGVAATAPGLPGGNAGQQITQQATPPALEQIRNQIGAQGLVQ